MADHKHTRLPPRGINLHPNNNLPSDLNTKVFDVVVLGSGPAGRTLATLTATQNLSTVIIESELWGGDCPFWACVPSKALLRPEETLEAGRAVTGAAGLIAKEPKVDVKGVFQRRDKFTQGWDDTFLVDLSHSQDCYVVRGHGSLVDEKQVHVKNVNGEEVMLKANHAVVLATGSDPVVPKISGLLDIPYWSPRDATSSDTVPDHLIIVGAGAVGCEMATAYSTYGSKVSLVASTAEILPKAEPQAGKLVRQALEAAGVDVYLSKRVQSVAQDASGKITAVLDDGKSIVGTKILIASGRAPRVAGIGLEELQIKLPLSVDDQLNVASASGNWLYAIGDASGAAFMTHMGSYQARIGANIIISRAKGVAVEAQPWSKFNHTADSSAVSQVIFTDPHVAFVGLTVAAAEAKGIKVKVSQVPSFQYPGAWLHAEFNYEGWAQWVIDADKNVLVGATFVGREVANLLHASTVAIVSETPVHKLQHAVAPFPTLSEIYTALSMAIP